MKDKNRKSLSMIFSLLLIISMIACTKPDNKNGSEEVSTSDIESEIEQKGDKAAIEEVEEKETGKKEEVPSGIQEDGIGEDPEFGEGIGEVISLSEEERTYMLEQTTNSWLEMTEIEKDDLVVLMGRWMEETKGYIVEDYDELILMLDHQMEQYYRNGIDESVIVTVFDILDME